MADKGYFVPTAAQVDLAKRLANDNESEAAYDPSTEQHVSALLNEGDYVGVSPEYRNHANVGEKPFPFEGNEAVVHEAVVETQAALVTVEEEEEEVKAEKKPVVPPPPPSGAPKA